MSVSMAAFADDAMELDPSGPSLSSRDRTPAPAPKPPPPKSSASSETAAGAPLLMRLPTELVHGVFANVEPEDLEALRLTCRRTNVFVAGNQTLHRDVYLRVLDEPREGVAVDWEAALRELVRLRALLRPARPYSPSSFATYQGGMFDLPPYPFPSLISSSASNSATASSSSSSTTTTTTTAAKRTAGPTSRSALKRSYSHMSNPHATHERAGSRVPSIAAAVERLLASASSPGPRPTPAATSTGPRPTPAATSTRSRNMAELADLFADPEVRDAVLCRSYLYERARHGLLAGRGAGASSRRVVAPLHNWGGVYFGREGEGRANGEEDEAGGADNDGDDDGDGARSSWHGRPARNGSRRRADKRSGAGAVMPLPFADPPEEVQQLSAKLHCLYGVPELSFGRNTRQRRMYPFACSKVYDLRQYTPRTRWGPFRDDGSDRVDWEKVEAVMIVLGNNIKRPGLNLFPIFKNIWETPFAGSWPHSYTPMPLVKDPDPLESRDPYNVTGTWLRVVCFLDYTDFFTYNFPPGDPPPDNVPRPILDVGEATRLILMKVHVTSIDPPGPDDGQGLPVVSFRGISRSLEDSWDENANTDLRGEVRLTREGEVRWTTWSIFSGQERWRSEGVQVGGLQSARGVIGNWFDTDYDPNGPAGPTAFWKISDRSTKRNDREVLLNDFLPVINGEMDLFDENGEFQDDESIFVEESEEEQV